MTLPILHHRHIWFSKMSSGSVRLLVPGTILGPGRDSDLSKPLFVLHLLANPLWQLGGEQIWLKSLARDLSVARNIAVLPV